jgi:DNA adenine methylase
MYALSPMRYPGAKWRLEKFVSSILKDNALEGGHYAEPYAGGGSLALSLLFQGYVNEIHLNDLDRAIYAFWKTIIDHSDEIIDRIISTPVTMNVWFAQKTIQADKQYANIFDLGFSTFFLNRTNRSGILNAGVIGGKAQTGNWKIDARFNKDNLIERIKRIASFRSCIHVTNMDALTFIKTEVSSFPDKSFIYLDPPYFVKGQSLYMNAYKPEDHAHIAFTILHELKQPWMVSYDDVPEIQQLYKGIKKESYVLHYCASRHRKGREVVFLSPRLKVQPELLIDV